MHKTLYSSAARATGLHTSVEISAAGFTGGKFYLVASPGTTGGTVLPRIQSYDKTSGNWVDVPGAIYAATGTSAGACLVVHPAITTTVNAAVPTVLGDTLRAISTVATASVTFSLGVDLIR